VPHKLSAGHDDTETGEAIKKSKPLKKGSSAEEKKVLASEYEEQLKSKHQDKYTRFQYKLWAEMLVSGVHSSTDDPPAASMFMHEAKHPKRNESTVNETVIDGMMSVMNTLCQALTPKHGGEKRPSVSTGLSPMKRDLRSTYLKQLGEIRQLHDAKCIECTRV